MLKMGGANHFRRTLAGSSLIVAPLVLLAAEALDPNTPQGDLGRTLAGIAEHPERLLAANLLNVLAVVLFVPAALGLLHLLRGPGRGTVLGHVGGGLFLLGLLGFMGYSAFNFVLLEMAAAGPVPAEVFAFGERLGESPGLGIVLLMWLGGLFLGLPTLAAGLYRAGVVPGWTASLVFLWVVVELTLVRFSKLAEVSGFVLLLVALGYVGLKVLRTSDEQWARTGPRASHGIAPPPVESRRRAGNVAS